MGDQNKTSILVVDDESAIRNSIAGILARSGYECHKASGGYEAIRIISNGFRPDLIVTDMNMPALDGLQLALWLEGQSIEMHIIFMSGDFGPCASDEFQRFSCRFLAKPFEIKILIDAIEEILG